MTEINHDTIDVKIELDLKYLEGMAAAYEDICKIARRMANKVPEFNPEHRFYSRLAQAIEERSAIINATVKDILK